MRKCRIIAAMLVAVALLSGLPAYATGATGEPVEGERKQAVLYARPYSEITLEILPTGGDASTLSMPADIVVFYGTGWREFFPAPGVTWQLNELDVETPGRQMAKGVVSLPDDYAWYNDDGTTGDLIIEQPVLVYDPAAEPVEEVTVEIAPHFDAAALLPLGCSVGEAEEILQGGSEEQVLLETAERYIIWCDYSLDISKIELDTAGAYLPYTLDAPPCFMIPDSFMHFLTVYVLEPDEVDLSAAAIDRNGFMLCAEWLFEAQEPTVWYTRTSPVGEDAQPDWLPFEYADVYDTMLSVNLFDVDDNALPGDEYWIQVRHTGGESNYLYLNTDTMAFAPVPTDGDRSGGDRDPGGSNSIPELPGVDNPEDEQPPEQPPYLPPFPPPVFDLPATQQNDEPEDVKNEPVDDDVEVVIVSDQEVPRAPSAPEALKNEPEIPIDIQEVKPVSALTSDVIVAPKLPEPSEAPAPQTTHPNATLFSGSELATLLEIHGGVAPFSDETGTVWLPEGIVPLGSAEEFSVLLQWSETNQLEVRLWSDGQALEGPFGESFELAIPWTGGEVTCTDYRGTTLPCRLDSENGLLLISADETGFITLHPLTSDTEEVISAATEATEKPVAAIPVPVPAPAEQNSPFFPMMITGVLGASGVGAAFAFGRHSFKLRRRNNRP